MQGRGLVVGLVVALGHAEAWAQGGSVSPPNPKDAAPAPLTRLQDDPRVLDAVTVTAQYREENVQKIPLAVSVVSAQAMERSQATDIGNLPTLVPSVTFSAGNELRNNSIRIRGMGTDVFSTGVEPSVSTVVDGVVLQRPGAAFTDLVDIDRVEVLRGPQGTLFGRNASAGVVNVITRAPDFDRTSGSFSALAAQDSEYRVNGAVSGPLGDGFAYRLAAFHRSQDGIVENLHSRESVNGQTGHGLRGKLAWRSADTRSDVTLVADYSKLDADCCALPLVQASDNPRAVSTGTAIDPDSEHVNNDVTPFVHQQNLGVALTANIDLAGYVLTSITAWRKYANHSNVDLDDTQGRFITRNYNIESSRTRSQELRLASPIGGAIDYVLGAYYYEGTVSNTLDRRGLNIAAVASINPDGSLVPLVPGDQATLAGTSVVEGRNASLFGQGNWHVNDRFTLTAGMRFIDERQTLHFDRPQAAYFNGVQQPPTSPAFGPVTGRYADTAIIGKASGTYAFTPQITGYAAWSTGYKGEGLATTLGLTAAQFAQLPAPAETSRQLEAGLKTTLLDNALMLNLTGFRTHIENYQAQTYNGASGLFLLTSAGGVTIDGLEIEFTARPFAYFSATGGVTWLDARFQDVPNGPCYAGQSAAQGCLPSGAGGTPVQNLDGRPFMNAPRWRYTLSARYDAPLTRDIDLYVQSDYRWQDTVVFDISQNPDMTQRAYGVADLSAGVIFDAGRYDLGVYIKNLADQQYAANIVAVSTAGGANAYAQQIPRDFRRYAGLSFRMSF